MKKTLFFLLLITLFPRSSFTQSSTPFSLTNHESESSSLPCTLDESSPLMIFEWLFGKKNVSHEDLRHDNEHRAEDFSASQGTPEGALEQNGQAQWNLVNINPQSQELHLKQIILQDNIALKSQLKNNELLEARKSSIALHLQAQEALTEIAANNVDSLAQKKAHSLAFISMEARSKLPQRNIILDSGGQDNKVQQWIQWSELSGEAIIKALQQQLYQEPNQEKQEEITQQIITTVELVQQLQQLMLGCHTPFYITAAKDRLNNLHDSLLSNPALQELRASLDSIKTRYLFAEAAPRDVTLSAVTDIINELQSELEKLQHTIQLRESQLSSVSSGKKANFDMLLAQKKRACHFLQRAILFYSQIENELTIETETSALADLKELIEKKLAVLEEISSLKNITIQINEDNKSALILLKEALCNPDFRIAERTTTPQDPLNFLTLIPSLQDIHDDAIITGENGKIILENKRSESPEPIKKDNSPQEESSELTDQIQKKQTDGINLIRFALARKYGMQAVGFFDSHFAVESSFDLGISVRVLKNFLQQKISIPPSHFLSSLTSIDKFITELHTASQSAPLKWSKGVADFNPFLPTQVITSPEDMVNIHRNELVAAIAHAREAVKKILSTFSITPNRTDAVFKRFNNQFNQRSSLTAGDLRAFIDTETAKIRRSPTDFWEDHMTDSIRSGLISGVASGTASVGIALFAHHLLALNLYCFLTGAVAGFIISHIILPALL